MNRFLNPEAYMIGKKEPQITFKPRNLAREARVWLLTDARDIDLVPGNKGYDLVIVGLRDQKLTLEAYDCFGLEYDIPNFFYTNLSIEGLMEELKKHDITVPVGFMKEVHILTKQRGPYKRNLNKLRLRRKGMTLMDRRKMRKR